MPDTALLQAGLEPFPGYRLKRPLGAGGFSKVWKAVTSTGKTLALKFMVCDARRGAAREVRSIQAVGQLRHPHLIQIEGVWCYGGYVVVAMELADGSLEDLLQVYQARYGTAVLAPHACLLLSEAAAALDFLNARQHRINDQCVAIQHCDVKPSNLLLLGETLKVADFGLASWLGSSVESRPRAGTLDYCAPEIFQGKLSTWSDQYALAVTYCQVRGGRLPFPNAPTSFRSQYVRPAPDLTMVPEPERPILARALDPVPQNRWSTCGELMSRLSAVIFEAENAERARAQRAERLKLLASSAFDSTVKPIVH